MADADVNVVEFDNALAEVFARLNYAWIEQNYTVEPHDREVLDHPVEHIIELGGQIFFAVVNGVPVGTVALIENGPRSFELAKMAVSPEAQGKGIGKLLLQQCIQYATARGKAEVVLESNTKQAAAVHLYREFGFIEIPLDPNSQFKRANIRMRLALSPDNL